MREKQGKLKRENEKRKRGIGGERPLKPSTNVAPHQRLLTRIGLVRGRLTGVGASMSKTVPSLGGALFLPGETAAAHVHPSEKQNGGTGADGMVIWGDVN